MSPLCARRESLSRDDKNVNENGAVQSLRTWNRINRGSFIIFLPDHYYCSQIRFHQLYIAAYHSNYNTHTRNEILSYLHRRRNHGTDRRFGVRDSGPFERTLL